MVPTAGSIQDLGWEPAFKKGALEAPEMGEQGAEGGQKSESRPQRTTPQQDSRDWRRSEQEVYWTHYRHRARWAPCSGAARNGTTKPFSPNRPRTAQNGRLAHPGMWPGPTADPPHVCSPVVRDRRRARLPAGSWSGSPARYPDRAAGSQAGAGIRHRFPSNHG